MICYIANKEGVIIAAMDRAAPKCGEAYCDTCGDCLHCHSEDPCIDGKEHLWVVYMEDEDAPKSEV